MMLLRPLFYMSSKVSLVDTYLGLGLLGQNMVTRSRYFQSDQNNLSYQDISIRKVAQRPYQNLVTSALLIQASWNKVVPHVVLICIFLIGKIESLLYTFTG